MVVSPWALERSQLQSVRIEGARTVRVTGDALPFGHGWMIQGLSQLVPDPDDGARFLYLRDGRAEYTSRAGRVSRIGGEGVAERAMHGLRAREADLSEVRALHVGRADGGAVVAGYGTAGGYVALIAPPGVVWVVAGGGTDTAADGVPGRKAMLQGPAAVVRAEDGPDERVYFAEKLGHRVRYVDGVGTVRLLAGYDGEADFAGDGGQASAAKLDSPAGLALDVDGSLFVADTGNHVIRRIGTNGIITTVAGTPQQPTDGTHLLGDGAAALLATLVSPGDLAVEVTATAAGERLLFIADTGNCRVRALHLEPGPAQGFIETYAGNGTCGGITAAIDAAQSALPTGLRLAVDGAGNLYLSDPGADPGTAKVFRVDRVTRQVVAVLGGGPGGEASAHLGVQLGDLGAVGVGPDGSWLVAAAAIAGGQRGLAIGWYTDPDALRSDMVVTWPEAGIRELRRDGDTERFDVQGRLVWALRAGVAAAYEYDTAGRLAAVRGVGGEAYTLTYRSSEGTLQLITSPTNKITEFLFDAAGHLVFTWGNENATALFFYDGGHLLLGDKAIDATQFHIEYRGDGIVGRVWYEGLELNATMYDDGSGEEPTLLPPEVYAVGAGAKCASIADCDVGLLCLSSVCMSPAPPAPDFDEDDGPWSPPGGFGGSPGPCPPVNPDPCKWYIGIDGYCYGQPLQKAGCPCTDPGKEAAKGCLTCFGGAGGSNVWTGVGEPDACRSTFECAANKAQCDQKCEKKDTAKGPEGCGTCMTKTADDITSAAAAACDDACLCPRQGAPAGTALGSKCSGAGENVGKECRHFSTKLCNPDLTAKDAAGCFYLRHFQPTGQPFYEYQYCRDSDSQCGTFVGLDGEDSPSGGARIAVCCNGPACHPCDSASPTYYLLLCRDIPGKDLQLAAAKNNWRYIKQTASASVPPKCTDAVASPGVASVLDLGFAADDFDLWQAADKSQFGAPVIPPPAAQPLLCNWSPQCADAKGRLHCEPLRGCQWPTAAPTAPRTDLAGNVVVDQANPCASNLTCGWRECAWGTQSQHGCPDGNSCEGTSLSTLLSAPNQVLAPSSISSTNCSLPLDPSGNPTALNTEVTRKCYSGTCTETATPVPPVDDKPYPSCDGTAAGITKMFKPAHSCTETWCPARNGVFEEGDLTPPPTSDDPYSTYASPMQGHTIDYRIGSGQDADFGDVFSALTSPDRIHCANVLQKTQLRQALESMSPAQRDLFAPPMLLPVPANRGVSIRLLIDSSNPAASVPLRGPADSGQVQRAHGGGILHFQLSDNTWRRMRCGVLVTSDNRKQGVMPEPAKTSCYADVGSQSGLPISTPGFPATCPSLDKLDNYEVPKNFPWRYPCPDGVSCADGFTQDYSASGNFYVEGVKPQAYRPQGCACDADGNLGGGLAGSSARVTVLDVSGGQNSTTTGLTLTLNGVTDIQFRGIDFVVPATAGPGGTRVFEVQGTPTEPVARLQFVGNRLLDVEFGMAFENVWEGSQLSSAAILPAKSKHQIVFVEYHGEVRNTTILRNAFCPPLSFALIASDYVHSSDFRNQVGGLLFADNRVLSGGKTIELDGQQVRMPTAADGASVNGPDDPAVDDEPKHPACTNDRRKGFIFSRNIFEGGQPYPCWGQWGASRALQMGAVDYLTVGPHPDDPNQYARPESCIQADTFGQASALPAWAAMFPNVADVLTLWTPEFGPRCSDDGKALETDGAGIPKVLAHGGNVFRRQPWPLAFSLGGTHNGGCSVFNADTPRRSMYSRCVDIRGNGFELSAYAELSHLLNSRFENNALCGMAGNADPADTTDSNAVVQVRGNVHDLSVCANRIDGTVGRFIQHSSKAPTLSQGETIKQAKVKDDPATPEIEAKPHIDNHDYGERTGIEIAPLLVRVPHDQPVPTRYPIRVVANAIGGVTTAGLHLFSFSVGLDPRWVRAVYGGKAIGQVSVVNTELLGEANNSKTPPSDSFVHASASDGVQALLWAYNAVRLRRPEFSGPPKNPQHAPSAVRWFDARSVDDLENVRTYANRYGMPAAAGSFSNGMCLAGGPRIWPYKVTSFKTGVSTVESACMYAHLDGVTKLGEAITEGNMQCLKPEEGTLLFAAGASAGLAVCGGTGDLANSTFSEELGHGVCPLARSPDKYFTQSEHHGRLDDAAVPQEARCFYQQCTLGAVPSAAPEPGEPGAGPGKSSDADAQCSIALSPMWCRP